MATITNEGKVAVAKLLNGTDSVPEFTYMAIGTGSNAEEATQTALVTETSATGLGRAAATCTYDADYKAKWTHTFTNNSGDTVGINEMGVFNASSSGTMLLRHVYAAVQNVLHEGSAEFTAIVTVATS